MTARCLLWILYYLATSAMWTANHRKPSPANQRHSTNNQVAVLLLFDEPAGGGGGGDGGGDGRPPLPPELTVGEMAGALGFGVDLVRDTPQHGLSSNKMAASIVLYYTPFRGLSSDTMALITPECGTMRSPSTKWRESPRIVAQCAPRAPNGPHHLGLCAPCRGQPDERLVPVDDGPSQPPARVLPILPPSPLHPY